MSRKTRLILEEKLFTQSEFGLYSLDSLPHCTLVSSNRVPDSFMFGMMENYKIYSIELLINSSVFAALVHHGHRQKLLCPRCPRGPRSQGRQPGI